MKNGTYFLLFISLITLTTIQSTWASVLTTAESAQFVLEAEGYAVWQGRNVAAIPGDTGSRFSLEDVLDSPIAGYRIEPVYLITERHQLRGVFAPLSLEDTGTLSQPVTFQGTVFNPTTPVDAVFKFNSYRLTYRYAFVHDHERWLVFGGFTAKVRDAKISLRQGSLFQEKSNVGFVPLLYGAAAYRLSSGWRIEVEFDALAAPQGRAEDLRVGLRKRFSTPGFSALVGYRILEGGADNDEVYTFSLFHYLAASIGYSF